MEKENKLIKLNGINKREDYAGISYDIVIDNAITLKNVDIVVHKVIDCIDLFCFRKDQTKDVLKNLERYKSKELSSSVEYKIPNNSIPVRIIMC